MSDESVSVGPGASISQWGRATAGLGIGVGAVLLALELAWPGTDGLPIVFLVGVVVTVLLESALVFWIVAQGHRTAGSEPFTLATWVTTMRAVATAVLAGFVLVPLSAIPSPGLLAWVPATLFAAAAALDALDGLIARRTGTTTELGARLDVETDALAVLVGTVVGVVAGSLPLVFFAVGGARYAFVAGCWLRRRRGRPVHELPPSQLRRVLGALAMVTIWLALLPPIDRGVSRAIAILVAIPFLLNFVRDWLAITDCSRR